MVAKEFILFNQNIASNSIRSRLVFKRYLNLNNYFAIIHERVLKNRHVLHHLTSVHTAKIFFSQNTFVSKTRPRKNIFAVRASQMLNTVIYFFVCALEEISWPFLQFDWFSERTVEHDILAHIAKLLAISNL